MVWILVIKNLLPAIQYLPKEEEDKKNLLFLVANMFIIDIETHIDLLVHIYLY